MDYVWGIVLILGSLGCWLLNVVGLPGNWLVVVLGGVYAQFGPARGGADIGWGIVAGLALLALLGELVEFAATAWGTKRAGGSKRGALLALAGSITGGIAGVIVGVPIPVVGSLVAAILGASLGALAGAVAGEQWKGRGMDDSLRIGGAAFWSRLAGTLGKTLVGAIMVSLLAAALLV